MKNKLDAVDIQILEILQANARTANVEIARRLKMAPSAVLGRIRKLENNQLIRGYRAFLNAADLGFGLVAFVFVREEKRGGVPDTEASLLRIPEIQSIFHVAGEDCFLLKVSVSDPGALGQLVREHICALPGVAGTRTTIVLRTIKDSWTLPLSTTSTPPKRKRGRT